MRENSGRESKNRETEVVIFVPCTRGGRLQKELQAVEDQHVAGTRKKRIRVVEKGGTKLKDILCSKNKTKPEAEKCKGIY